MRVKKAHILLARKAVGGALFGGAEAFAEPENDETTFCQTQGRLVTDVAKAFAALSQDK